MTDAPRFAFADFDCTISLPWSGDEIELVFGERHRAAWQGLPVSGIETRVDDGVDDDAEDERARLPELCMMGVALGTVSAERRFADGVIDAFVPFALELHLEPGPWGEIRRRQMGRGTTLWSPRFEGLFVRVVTSLCEATVPPAVKLPRATPRRCTAEALSRGGWVADGGAELACGELDACWDPGTRLDVPRLLGAIERGESHRRGAAHAHRPLESDEAPIDAEWAVLRSADGSVRLVTPLAIELLRVEVVGHAQPGYLTARYFLAIDLDARGALEYVSIRAARDGTFDAETDDSPSIFAERDPDDDRERLRDKLAELAYTATSWVVEEHLYDPLAEDGAA